MNPAALVTGAARRIGREISMQLHGAGYDLAVHYHQSEAAAVELTAECNQRRPHSAVALKADLHDAAGRTMLVEQALAFRPHYALLVNNAAVFRATPLADIRQHDWDEIMGLNLFAPLALCQGLAPVLRGGSIVNITDIYAHRPLTRHLLYCLSKAGLTMLTQALALELAPHVRVNAVAPGAILPPAAADPARMQAVGKSVPLGGPGTPQDVARAVLYLARDGAYLNGQVLVLDGGRLLPVCADPGGGQTGM